jgi:ribosomal protein S6
MSLLRRYEIMILLTEEFNDSELKTWVFNYAKSLRKFSVCNISVISRGKHNLAYSIKDRVKGNYIQLNFSSMPKYIHNFSKILTMDSNVLRFLVFKKEQSS